MTRILLFILALFLATPAIADEGINFEAGRKAYQERKWPYAILHLRPLAEMGDTRAMILLGNMYLDGFGVPKNPKEAFKLYYKAALRHNPDAMVMVAALYQQGIGTLQNPKFAIAWYGRAARLGHKAAAVFYALHLYRGNRGRAETDFSTKVEPDHEAAYKWFRIASDNPTNEKSGKAAAELALRVAMTLPKDRLAILNDEVRDWKPETPPMLGPTPEEEEKAAKEKKPEEAKPEEAKPATP